MNSTQPNPFQSRLNDGTYDFELVRPEQPLPDGRANVALYERIPRDEAHQFTPDLAFVKGLTKSPVMHKLQR